jgi:hypothetical protein
VIFAGCTCCPSLEVHVLLLNALVMDCCLVALSRARGEKVFGINVPSSASICFHLWAMGRSHNGVELMSRMSLAQCSGFVDESNALRYVRAACSDRGRGLRMVRLAHLSSLSSRKYGRPYRPRPRIYAQP